MPPWPHSGCLGGKAALSTCFWWWCHSLGGAFLARQLLPSSCLGLQQVFLHCLLAWPCSLLHGVGARGLHNRGRRHLCWVADGSRGGLWELVGSFSLGLLQRLGGDSLGDWHCRRDSAGLGTGSGEGWQGAGLGPESEGPWGESSLLPAVPASWGLTPCQSLAWLGHLQPPSRWPGQRATGQGRLVAPGS